MNDEFQCLLDDVDLGIRSKIDDLKGCMATLVTRVENFSCDLNQGGSNGDLKSLADIQARGLIVERICEEIMTLLTVRKRIQVYGASALFHPLPGPDPQLQNQVVI